MTLLRFVAKHDGHHLTIQEHGKTGVTSLTLTCLEHGLIDTYGLAKYPKYRLALHAAEEAGAEHVGLDRLTFL